MNRTALLAGIAFSACAFAQAPDQAAIDKALLAAPANQKAGATVIKWKPDYTYDTLKKGTNKLVCYDKSGLQGQPAFLVECTNAGNLPRATQKTLGLPENGQQGGVWIMNAGTTTAHLMVPGE